MQLIDFFESVYSAVNQHQAQLENLSNKALSRGIDLYMRKDYKGAVKEFQRSMGLSPQSSYAPEAAQYMADAHLALGDKRRAEKALKEGLRLDPYRDDIHVKLGNLYFTEERYSDAVRAYEKAVKLNGSSTNVYSLGQAYMQTGRHGEAELQFLRVLRMEPETPYGNFGLGRNYSRQRRYEDAIRQFQMAIDRDSRFYDARAEMGYALADTGDIDGAVRQVELLQNDAPELAETLSNYIYEVDPPKIRHAFVSSGFSFYFPMKTRVSTLDAYLQHSGAEKMLSIKFMFDKELDRASVENALNWRIARSSNPEPGGAYNFGRPLPESEIELPPYPHHIYYDQQSLTATVYFKIRQNASADGTIDPSHVEFRFDGKDVYGNRMDAGFDQFTGFSGVF
jgi:tetratricopeptide (TPR) repeat protein